MSCSAESTPGKIDPASYREVMGHYPTGVAVVTGMFEQRPIGMVVGTFSAVSLDPPLVAFMPTVSSGTYARLATAPAYCINVLAHNQLELCRSMAVPRPDKFDGVSWMPSSLGAPMLQGAVAHIDCTPQSVVPAGDHYIVLCDVRGMRVSRPVTPLLFFQGGYGGFSARGLAAKGDAELITAVRLAETARPQIERLARTLECEAAVLVAINADELTTAASAYGGCASVREPLGERIPLIPPIGEAYIAGAKPDVVERWLLKASSQAPDVLERYRRRLAAVEARGAALAMIGPAGADQYAQLHDALREYAAGDLTPARERAVRSVIAEMSHFFETMELQDDETYHIGSVVVPVRNPGGDTSLVLRLTQLPRDANGRTVKGWISMLKEAAVAVEHNLGGDRAAELQDYREWYHSDFPL